MTKFSDKLKAHKISIYFTEEQMSWVKSAAKMFETTPKDLVGNCFWEEFTRLSKEIAEQIAKEEQGKLV